MYERNAVILEKYFSDKFYYNDRSNLKNNFENFQLLIDILEKYQDVSDAEDKIIKECEEIATQIKQIQRNQSNVFRKTLKMQQDRNNLFESIDESAEELGKQLDRIEKSIDKYNARMRPIDQEFIDTIARFNEKSDIRSECGKKRRKIEKEYRSILERTKNVLNEIEIEKIVSIKTYVASENKGSNEELKSIILKNGEKERIPFDTNVVENAILFGQAIYKKEANILLDIYDQANNVVNDINNNTVKISKYKKAAKDSRNLLRLINAQKDYLVQFLDNERLAIGLGSEEHTRLMKDACADFTKDTVQIANLNELLIGEISDRANYRMYSELYSAEYLINLKVKEREFERKLRKLNMVGQILNPIYWRIVSIEKLYTIFDEIVQNEYDRDLSNYKITYNDEPEDIEDQPTYEEASDDEDDFEDNYIIQDSEDTDDEEVPEEIETIENEEKSSIIKTKRGRKPKKDKRSVQEEEKEEDLEEEINTQEIEDSNDLMSYYDNLDTEKNESNNNDNQEDDDYEGIYPNYREEFNQSDEEDDSNVYDNIFQNNYNKEDYSEEKENIFFNEDDEDDYDDDLFDDEDDDVYDDIETILKNRRKQLNRSKKAKASKRKGFFGFGSKK